MTKNRGRGGGGGSEEEVREGEGLRANVCGEGGGANKIFFFGAEMPTKSLSGTESSECFSRVVPEERNV